jgi:hypothetical protein
VIIGTAFGLLLTTVNRQSASDDLPLVHYKVDEMSGAVTFLRMPRSKPKTIAEGKEQLSSSLARMASAPVASKRVPITEIGFGQCRFIVEDRSFPALCCGEPTLGGSWCPQHRALVFVRVPTGSNGRKLPQEPVAAPRPTPIAPAALAKPAVTPATPVTAKVPAARPDRKTEQAAQAPKKSDAPEKGKHRTEVPAAKAATVAAERGAAAPTKAKGAAKVSPKRDEKPAVAAAKPGGRSAPAKKPVTPQKPAAAKPAAAKSAAKKTPAKKTVAKQASSTKSAAARKSSAAKRTAPAKKTAASRKTTASKGKVPAKKARPAGKGAKRKKAG